MSGYYNRNNRGITKKLGPVTAYADAVLAGYKGTREQWAQDMAKLGQNVTQVAQNTELTTELAEQTRENTEQVAKDTADVRRLADETSDNAVQVASNTAESNRLAKETKQAAAQAKADAEYAGAAADNFRVDTTLSEEGKAAEAKTTGEKFAQLSEEIENNPNRITVDGKPAKTGTEFVDVIYKANKTNGSFYNGNEGFSVESSAWDYFTLQVKQGEKYRVCTFSVSNAYAVTIHKTNGEIIAKYPEVPNGSVVDIIFEIPAGASYIIANQQKMAFNLILEKEGKTYKFLSALREMTIEDYAQEIKYYDVKDNATKGTNQFISRSGGTLELEGWNTYELPVTAGETYKLKTAYASAAVMYAIYYADGNMTVYPTTAPTTEKVEEVLLGIPQNATRLIVNEHATVTSAVIEKQTDGVHFKKISDNADYLYGKKLAACGDSITEARNPNGGYFKNYAQIVAERHGMSCYVDGISGTTMANIGDGRAFSENRYKNVPDFDYLTIWFGWNDEAYSELGTINDTDNTTFYGGYKTVLDYLITNNPTKKIGLIVPYGNKGLEPYAQAVRELSQMYGVPCLDLRDYNKCSLIWGTENNAQIARRAALTYDTTHPNQAGYEYLSTMYEQFLLSL